MKYAPYFHVRPTYIYEFENGVILNNVSVLVEDFNDSEVQVQLPQGFKRATRVTSVHIFELQTGDFSVDGEQVGS